MAELTADDIQIIQEEIANLRTLRGGYIDKPGIGERVELLQQMSDLTDSVREVNSDELPQLSAQLERLDILVEHEQKNNYEPIDLLNPYFAHMRLLEESRSRDLYLGNQVYRSIDGSIQIIDWKMSPISLIYFLYEQGECYEEEIGGRLFEGEVVFKRIVRVDNGEVVKIQQGGVVLLRNRSLNWERHEERQFLLRGGAGIALRPANTATINPASGFDLSGHTRKDKLLTEITALIDPEQFELITQPQSGIVAIQGTAGSGKTTVALHRVAWLHFQDPRRFAAEKIMVMVFNKALANYISRVLPSLGVNGVGIDYFENWASSQRIRLLGGRLPTCYSDATPASVIRFKKHPVLLRLIRSFIRERESRFETQLAELIDSKKVTGFPLDDLNSLPLITRAFTLFDWIEGKNRFMNRDFSFNPEVRTLAHRLIRTCIDPEVSRVDNVLQYWFELFSDFKFLKREFLRQTDDFRESSLDEVIDWLKTQYIVLGSKRGKEDLDLLDVMTGKRSHKNRSFLDVEDDPILLFLYQRVLKDITKKDRTRLSYSHILIDEVQDMSPIEISILLNIAEEPHSLTMAGDVNQKMIENGGFQDWEGLFNQLELKEQTLSTLRVGYRSSFEIMEFALSVLGDLAISESFMAKKHGPPVELFQFLNQGELIHFLSKSLKELLLVESDASVAVICRTPEDAVGYYKLMEKMELPDFRLISDQDFPFTAGIDLTDIRQVKGLEFDYVVLLDVDAINYPGENYSRYLLHIGSTRAAHQLWIMNYREPAMFLPTSLIRRTAG